MNKKAQHILFILDRSGSMAPRANDVIGSFNTYVSEMQAEQAKDGLATIVSLVTFSDNHSVVFASKPVREVEPLTDLTYKAIGSTALLDTVYDSVTKYRERIGQGTFASGNPEDSPAVLVVVFTDGEENASKRASWTQVQELIGQTEALGNWTFTYVGAHPSAWSQASRLHVRAGNVLDAKDMTVHEMTGMVHEGTKRLREQYIEHGTKASHSMFSDEPADLAETVEV